MAFWFFWSKIDLEMILALSDLGKKKADLIATQRYQPWVRFTGRQLCTVWV